MRSTEFTTQSSPRFATAQTLAKELHDAAIELGKSHQSGTSDSSYIQKIKQKIQNIYQELNNLGYEYDPQVNGYVRPLTIDLG